MQGKKACRNLDFCTGLFCITEWPRARTPRFESSLCYFLASSSKWLDLSTSVSSWGCWKDLVIKYNNTTTQNGPENSADTKQANNHSPRYSNVLPGTGHSSGGSWEFISTAGVVRLCTKNIPWRAHQSGKGLAQWAERSWGVPSLESGPNKVRLGRESLAAVEGLRLLPSESDSQGAMRCTKKWKAEKGLLSLFLAFILTQKRGWGQHGSQVTCALGSALLTGGNLSCSLFPTQFVRSQRKTTVIPAVTPHLQERWNHLSFQIPNRLTLQKQFSPWKQTGTQLSKVIHLAQSKAAWRNKVLSSVP